MANETHEPVAPAAGQATAMADADKHERLCLRCGKCCFRKIIVGRSVIITPFPCEHLDLATRLCTVYARRRQVNKHCLGVADGLKVSAFPASCGYVQRLAPPGYAPALDDWSWAGQWHDLDDLAEDLGVSPRVREWVRRRGPFAPLPWLEAAGIEGPRSAP